MDVLRADSLPGELATVALIARPDGIASRRRGGGVKFANSARALERPGVRGAALIAPSIIKGIHSSLYRAPLPRLVLYCRRCAAMTDPA